MSKTLLLDLVQKHQLIKGLSFYKTKFFYNVLDLRKLTNEYYLKVYFLKSQEKLSCLSLRFRKHKRLLLLSFLKHLSL